MDKKYIALAIIVIVIIYFAFQYILSEKEVIKSNDMFITSEANAGLNSLKNKIKPGVISDFGYSFWIYVKSWDNEHVKNIISHGVQECGSTFKREIKLGTEQNNLTIKIPHSNEESGISCGANELNIANIPLQRWVHIAVTVHNRSLDVYLNGKMVKTSIMTGVPAANDAGSSLVICNPEETYSGKFSRFSYHEKALNPRDVRAIYAKGPEPTGLLGGLFGKYKIKLLFMKGSDKVSEFSV